MSQMFLRLQSAFSGNAAKVASTSSSARTVAKDRLSVILASQRGSELFDSVCMETLQKDVLKVVEVCSCCGYCVACSFLLLILPFVFSS